MTSHIRKLTARRRTKAFTLAELSLTILVVGVGLVACMRALPVLLRSAAAEKQLLVSEQLAGDLLAEISLLPFEEPNGTPSFGPETGEVTGTRALFDDIDDYAGWTESPPCSRAGLPDPAGAGFTRSVAVVSVLPTDFNSVASPGATDAKRITVTVSKPGVQTVILTTVRLRGSNRED